MINDKQNNKNKQRVYFYWKNDMHNFTAEKKKKAGDKSIAEIENLISWLFSNEYCDRISRLVD